MTALDAQQRGDLLLPFGAAKVGRGSSQHQIAWMALNGAINRIDHIQCAARGTAVCDIPGPHVKRKEFGTESTLLHAFNAGAIRYGRRATEIVVVIRHRRRHIVVRVNDDSFAVYLEGSWPDQADSYSLRQRAL